MAGSRPLSIPLGERTTNKLQSSNFDAELLSFRSSFDLAVKTPFSSASSSSSSSSSSGSGNGSVMSLDSSSPVCSPLDIASITTTDRMAFAQRMNRTSTTTTAEEISRTPHASPSKLRSKVPSLDAIACRMRGLNISPSTRSPADVDEQENGVSMTADTRGRKLQPFLPSTHTTPTQGEQRAQRGRSEALSCLYDRAATRSRSTSPTKKAGGEAAQGEQLHRDCAASGLKEVPSLQDIVKRMSSKKGSSTPATSNSAASSPALGGSSPALSIASLPTPSTPQTSTTRASTSVQASPDESAKGESPSKTGSVKPNEHPLEHKWSMYFDSKTWNPSSSQGSEPKSPAPIASSSSWESTLKLLGQYRSVESFMTVFRTLRRPSQMERNSNYHLFKENIKPMWEDSANMNGGKWTITFRSANAALLDRSWMWLVLALIGEDLDEADHITGAVVSMRAKGDRIALWIRDKNNVELANKIGRRLLSLLELEREPGVSMEFSINNNSSDVGDTSTSSVRSSSSSRGAMGERKYYFLSNPLPAASLYGAGSGPQNLMQREASTGNVTGFKANGGGHHFLSSSPRTSSVHASPAQQNGLNATLPGSPIQGHGTLGAHLRLHGSPSKFNGSARPSSMLNVRGSQLSEAMSADTNANQVPLSGLGFSMGLGASIGRTSSPSSALPTNQRPGFGLMNRTRTGTTSRS